MRYCPEHIKCIKGPACHDDCDKIKKPVPDNCIDCNSHMILPDPDPTDWFCDDDVKVVCQKAECKVITCACRPYRVREESERPTWCPRIEG